MKIALRKLVFAGVVATLTAAATTLPAHATISGSEPRPNASMNASAGYYFQAALAYMGFY
jgi:hypothetical protein